MKKILFISIITFLAFFILSACSSNKYDVTYRHIPLDVVRFDGILVEDEKLYEKFEKMTQNGTPDKDMILKMSDMIVKSHFEKRTAKDIFKRYTDISINQYNNYFIISRFLERAFEDMILDGGICMAITSDFKEAYTKVYYNDPLYEPVEEEQ